MKALIKPIRVSGVNVRDGKSLFNNKVIFAIAWGQSIIGENVQKEGDWLSFDYVIKGQTMRLYVHTLVSMYKLIDDTDNVLKYFVDFPSWTAHATPEDVNSVASLLSSLAQKQAGDVREILQALADYFAIADKKQSS